MNVMPIPELIARVTEICKKNGVKNCICLFFCNRYGNAGK